MRDTARPRSRKVLALTLAALAAGYAGAWAGLRGRALVAATVIASCAFVAVAMALVPGRRR